MKNTIPNSSLSATAKAEEAMYRAKYPMLVTFATEDGQRVTAGRFGEMDALRAEGWLVVDNTR